MHHRSNTPVLGARSGGVANTPSGVQPIHLEQRCAPQQHNNVREELKNNTTSKRHCTHTHTDTHTHSTSTHVQIFSTARHLDFLFGSNGTVAFAYNLSASPAPRSASAGPLSSPVRHVWRFGRAGPRLRAAATVVGMALVSGVCFGVPPQSSVMKIYRTTVTTKHAVRSDISCTRCGRQTRDTLTLSVCWLLHLPGPSSCSSIRYAQGGVHGHRRGGSISVLVVAAVLSALQQQ